MSFDADLVAAMFDGPLAADAALTPKAGGAAVAGRVLFDEAGAVALDVETREPSALASADSWPSAAIGDTLAIGARSFRVRGVMPEDDGATVRLVLARL